MEKYWMGPPPDACDLCQKPIKDKFVDGATALGIWGFMCPACFPQFGRGLGSGRGQEYTLKNGKFFKTGG